jgi:hypothetical protein
MQTQISETTTSGHFPKFQQSKLKDNNLPRIKGGSGDTPPEEGIIGVEEIVDM